MAEPTPGTPSGPRASAAWRLIWIAIWAAASVHFARLLPLHLPELPAGGAVPALAGLEGLWAWREVRLTGAIPLWNPFVPGGAPLVGAGQFHPLYPTGALAMVMDWALAARIDFGLHLLAGAMAAAMLARRLRATPAAAGFIGLLALLAIATLTARATEGRMLWRALALVPLAPLGAMAIDRGERAGGALAVALGIGTIGLAGEFGVAVAAIAAAMVPAAVRGQAGFGRNLGALAIAIAIGVAMGGAGWAPAEDARALLGSDDAAGGWEGARSAFAGLPASLALVWALLSIGIGIFATQTNRRKGWSVATAAIFASGWGAALWFETGAVSAPAGAQRDRARAWAEAGLDRLDLGEAAIGRLGPLKAFPLKFGQWAPPDQPGRMIQPVDGSTAGPLRAFARFHAAYPESMRLNVVRLTAANLILPARDGVEEIEASGEFAPLESLPGVAGISLAVEPRYLRQIKAKTVLPRLPTMGIAGVEVFVPGSSLGRIMEQFALHETGFNALELTYAVAPEGTALAEGIALALPTRDMGLEYELKRFAPGEIEIAYSARLDGLAHVAEPDLPGWRVTIDDVPAGEWRWPAAGTPPFGATLPGEGFFINVALPAGRHALRLSYDPLSWRLGVYLTLLGLGAAGALAGRMAGRALGRARPHGRAQDAASVLRSPVAEAQAGPARAVGGPPTARRSMAPARGCRVR